MAKRLTDTDKWKDDWYLSLTNDDKIVWQWLLDNCSHAGVCKRSVTFMNLMCRVSYTEDEMIKKMEDRVMLIGNIWFIPKFIKFQYATLNSAKPVIVSVVKELFTHNLIATVNRLLENDYKIISESFDNHYKMIKDKSKDKDKEELNSENEKNEKSKPVNFAAQGADVLIERASKEGLGITRPRK